MTLPVAPANPRYVGERTSEKKKKGKRKSERGEGRGRARAAQNFREALQSHARKSGSRYTTYNYTRKSVAFRIATPFHSTGPHPRRGEKKKRKPLFAISLPGAETRAAVSRLHGNYDRSKPDSNHASVSLQFGLHTADRSFVTSGFPLYNLCPVTVPANESHKNKGNAEKEGPRYRWTTRNWSVRWNGDTGVVRGKDDGEF